MLIKHVHIENFKRWETLDADLRHLDCLVGPNNSGKTSLLQVLALFDFCVHHCLSGKNGGFEIKSRSIAPEEFYVIPCANPKDLWTNRRTQAGPKHRIICITALFDNDFKATATVDLNYNRFGVSLDCSDRSDEALKRLRDVHISYLPVFSTFLAEEEKKTPAVIEDALARGRVNSVIRNLLLNLKSQKRENLLKDVLQRLFPDLQGISITFDEANDRYISFTYNEQGRPKEFDVFMAGSGFQQFVYLFGFIHLRQPTVILLDEPDVHLHGTLQHGLLLELNRLVETGKQVLIATHSRELIGRISPQNILSVDNGKATRLSVAFDVYDTLDKMGSVDPTQLPMIQAWRKVLVVENRTDWELLSVFCEKCLPAGVWPEVKRRVALCYALGNPWKQDMDRLRHQLQQMISVQGQALELFVVADRDYHPDLTRLRASLPQNNIQWHVWERTEIENYLLSWGGILKALHEFPLAEEPLRSEFDRLIESSRNSANDRLVKAFDEYRRKLGENWDAATLSRKAREFLEENWKSDRIGLADAKEIVLPGLKRWLQEHEEGQFSDLTLAEAMSPTDLADEVRSLAQRLADFAGVALQKGYGGSSGDHG